MFRAICIKNHDNIKKGEIVRAWQSLNMNMHYWKGMKLKRNVEETFFYKHFCVFKNSYSIEKPGVKRRFRKPKADYLNVTFKNISDDMLVLLYNCVFSYIEQVRQISPELILTFSYSIVTTLEKLEYLYKVLPPERFKEAIMHSEEVFREIYKTALGIEIESTPTAEDYEMLLKGFKADNDILVSFFNQLNKS